MKNRDHLAFLLILALGATLRLFHLTAPFVDAHAWRQLDTAAMARNFYEGSFIPLDPQVDWRGRRVPRRNFPSSGTHRRRLQKYSTARRVIRG
jgi:hypothetical protein